MGVYGARVILLFHKKGVAGGAGSACDFSNGLNMSLSHPVTGWVQGTHYAIADEAGNFTFDFVTTLGNWYNYWDVELFVTNWNDACYLLDDPDHPTGIGLYTIGGTGYPGALTGQPAVLSTFRLAGGFCGAANAGSFINYTGVVCTLDKDDGGILRNMELSQEFDNIKFGYAPPRVTTYGSTLLPGSATGTTSFIDIHIKKPDGGSNYLVDHEFGHWYMEMKGIDAMEFPEDFAEFHQFAVRNYEMGKYSEPFSYRYRDNQEENWSYVDNDPKSLTPHARWGATCGYSYNPIAGFAGLLWQVYDGYPASDYKALDYGNNNNEDVAEPSLLISLLNSIAPGTHNTRTSFAAALEAGVSTPAESTAIAAIYNCEMAPDPIVPNYPVFPPMNPATTKNLTGSLTSDHLSLPTYTASLTWSLQEYSADTWQNPPVSISIRYLGFYGYTYYGPLAGNSTSATFSYLAPIGADGGDFQVLPTSSIEPPWNPEWLDFPAMKIAIGTTHRNDASLTFEASLAPNPSNSFTKLRIGHTFPGFSLKVGLYDLNGRLVQTFLDGTSMSQDPISIEVNLEKVTSGTYFVRIENPFLKEERKIEVSR
jgi:hypothetical protein